MARVSCDFCDHDGNIVVVFPDGLQKQFCQCCFSEFYANVDTLVQHFVDAFLDRFERAAAAPFN